MGDWIGYLAAVGAVAAAGGVTQFVATRLKQQTPDPARLGFIDGLRGLLALMVVCHHFLVTWIYAATGEWSAPSFLLFANLAPAAVSVFFMITAYLFYGRVLRGHVDYKSLYIGRFFRIAPLYYFAFACAAALILAERGTAELSPLGAAKAAFHWLTFTIVTDPPFAGDPDPEQVLAGVIWTLRYEWLFYAALPLIGLLARAIRSRPVRIAGLAAIFALLAIGSDVRIHWLNTRFLAPFPLGMLAVEMQATPQFAALAKTVWGNLLAAGGFLLALALPGELYGLPRLVALFIPFYMIGCGADLFGLLRSRGAKLMGDASYSIYLLHGLVLHVLFAAFLRPYVQWRYLWAGLPAAAVLVCLLSLTTYALIERPFIRLGRRISTTPKHAATSEVAP